MTENMEKLVIDGQEHEIEVKPITLVYTSPNFHSRIEYPNRFTIGPEETLYHMDRVQTFHPRTPGMLAKVFKHIKIDQFTPDYCRQSGSGVKHAAGLIDLSLKFVQMEIPFMWFHPETFLHPAAQCELGDILVELVKNPPKSLRQEETEKIEAVAEEVINDNEDH